VNFEDVFLGERCLAVVFIAFVGETLLLLAVLTGFETKEVILAEAVAALREVELVVV
jgi:hypothetical protein